MTLVKFENDQEHGWFVVGKSDIVESFYNDSLKIVPSEYMKHIENGMLKNRVNEEIMENIEYDANYVDTYVDDYIRLDSLSENELYFDSYIDEFFDKDTLGNWEIKLYYLYSDGSNLRMKRIEETKEIEAEKISSEEYNTGTYVTYKTTNSQEFVVDYSRWQGSIPGVLPEYDWVIEEIL